MNRTVDEVHMVGMHQLSALSRHSLKFVEVKGTSATTGGGLAADGDLLLGRDLV